MELKSLVPAAAGLLLSASAAAEQVKLSGRPILSVASKLTPGQYVWAPELAPDGPMLVVVNLATQRLITFRNGVPIGASSVSSGKTGYETPTGVFTILQKAKEHRSRTYDNASMPNMQRLTWKGIALHAGKLPGYPASHGCIRLPPQFSALLFGATGLGMTVVITEIPIAPQLSAPPPLAAASRSGGGGPPLANAPFVWHPDKGKRGLVSVVASTADNRAIVLRDGEEIGSAPIRYSGTLSMPIAYVLEKQAASGNSWLKLYYEGSGQSMTVSADEGKKFDFPTKFRNDLLSILRPGSVVIVTPQPLKAGSPGDHLTVIDNGD